MPNTTRGLPYPAATDPVAQGAAAIQALAEAVDPRIIGAACRLTHSVAVAPANNTFTTLPFNTELFDNAAMHDNATNPERITITKSGLYLITGRVSWQAVAGTCVFKVLKNAALTSIAQTNFPYSTTEYFFAATAVLAAGDYIVLQVLQTSGAALNSLPVAAGYAPEFAASLLALA